MGKLIDADIVLSYIDRLSGCGLGKKKALEYLRKYVDEQPKQKTIKINLNETVKVKLTDFGRAIYQQGCDRLNEIIGEEFFCLDQLKEDKDGYVKFQLWSFMQRYGEYMGLGFPNVIEPLEVIWEGENR